MFPQSFKGRAFRALCHDGQVRRAVCTASHPWAWDAISAAVQVSFAGKRLTVSGNLGGLDRALHPDAPQGVEHRFHSEDLRAVVGWTGHKPVAPRLRKLAARLGLTRFGPFNVTALCWLAIDLRAAASRCGLVTARPGGDGGAHFTAEANRAALVRIKPEPLARMARLAWAFHCFKGHEGKGAWDTARRI